MTKPKAIDVPARTDANPVPGFRVAVVRAR